jgi:HAD superfamily hydrolase (TIGR01457 family)
MGTLADHYDCLLFDLDGVLYRGREAVQHAPSTLAALREGGHRLAFVTNNSARTPEAVAARLREVGIEAAAEEVETSALATASLLAARGWASAFIVGEDGLRSALEGAGLRVVGTDAPRVDAVVVGWDRGADYAKLRTASLLVERGAPLVATNTDASFPAPDGRWPGAGALLAAVTTTTGATAEVVGKPAAPLYRAALARAGGGRPLVIGDRLDTDIAGAAALGWDSLLVLTGISQRGDLEHARSRPTHVAEDLRALLAPDPLDPDG